MSITRLINRVGFMALINLIEKLSLLSQYILGAHHTTHDENMSSFLHGVNHKIEEVMTDIRVLVSQEAVKANPNILQRGIPFPVETNPSRD